jgi:hypothetical protein
MKISPSNKVVRERTSQYIRGLVQKIRELQRLEGRNLAVDQNPSHVAAQNPSLAVKAKIAAVVEVVSANLLILKI